MKSQAALSALLISVTIAVASEPKLADTLRPGALTAAQQLGSSELGCPTGVAKVLRQETIAEPQGTGWYEPPHRAEYIIAVSGCGKRIQYAVVCDNRHTGCKAGPVEAPNPPQTLADTLKPKAIKAAEQSGSNELGCPAAAAKVIRQATIDEPATSGWYEPPHRAAYTVSVSGCQKSIRYLVACDGRKNDCSVAAFQEASEGSPRQPQLADELQPEALKAAQAQGASELGCPAATARVLKQATILEPQTTGWYEPPHRAVYTVAVSGCEKSAKYLVGCNQLKNECRVRAPQ